jgi:ubiquinone/menaquinone biosynthesis C-methylase UbiE
MEKAEWDWYSDDYHSYIISPLQENVQNPIFYDIKKMKGREKMVCADVGCGPGDLLPVLSSNFKKVHAFDFSDKMISLAKKNNAGPGNISFGRADMRMLSKTGMRFDVIFAINSILHSKTADVRKALAEIYKSIKPAGQLIGIFPSMESVIYNHKLVLEQELRQAEDKKTALKNMRRRVEERKYNYVTGVYDDCSERQKFFYRFEIIQELSRAGFVDIKIDKVRYPWGEETGDFEDFEGNPEMWDWYIRARKNEKEKEDRKNKRIKNIR